ncbi:NADPH oxidase organizer 1-like [Pelodytes ibericus]
MRQDSHRHPVEVQAVGLVQHGRQKMYMFSILWSDLNNVLIYRTFTDFKKFQRELKRQFPLEGGALKKSERTIPKLKDAPKPWSKKKPSQKSLQGLHRLETYSQMLLNLDAKISQSQIVVHFFTIQKHDLNPSFPESSLVIMPSQKKEERTVSVLHNPAVSRPLVAHSYLCTDDFETIDLKNKPFIVKKNQILDVLLKEHTGWWLVENEDRQLAWFPAPYLKDLRDDEGSSSDEECPTEGACCVVVKAYEAQNFDEVSVCVGALVEVLKKSNNGWWLISYNRKTGFIPSIFLKPYTNPCEKFQNILSRGQYRSTPNIYDGLQNWNAYSQKEDRGSPGNRERFPSMGGVSLGSEVASYVRPDVECLVGSRWRSNAGSDDGSSTGSSSHSSSISSAPKIPARPNPEDIIQKCSTITKRAVEKSIARLHHREAEPAQQSAKEEK